MGFKVVMRFSIYTYIFTLKEFRLKIEHFFKIIFLVHRVRAMLLLLSLIGQSYVKVNYHD